jgi:membrane associated rhomboid family serine protease
MLLGFFYTTTLWQPSLPWFERGSADAARILNGELWRIVTALTLHVDFVHVVSNAIGIAIFLGAVSSLLGPGIGCALVLLAGAGGNFINALVQGPPHLSIGASTSVFGAVGILGGLDMIRRRRQTARRHRAWIPLAAGLALLGFLGTEGQHVDIWAHLFGFILGGFMGIGYGAAVPRRQGHRMQWASAAGALALLVVCWIIAIV